MESDGLTASIRLPEPGGEEELSADDLTPAALLKYAAYLEQNNSKDAAEHVRKLSAEVAPLLEIPENES